MHTVDDIEPGESVNMALLSAFEFNQATPHSLRLKAEAPWNMDLMSVTADTSHFDRSWLNSDALENMDLMSVTADTPHFDRSWLKVDASENMNLMSVMADTSQSPIGP